MTYRDPWQTDLIYPVRVAPSDFELVPDKSDQVMPALIAACPSFEAERLAAPDSLVGMSFPYRDMTDFARHLAAKLQRNETSEFPELFRVIEGLLSADQPGVRELVVVGLIEDLQNSADGLGSDLAERFRPWLGPVTARAWNEVRQFWRDVDQTRDIPGR